MTICTNLLRLGMVSRQLEKEISVLKHEFPIPAIVGLRQSGETSLPQSSPEVSLPFVINLPFPDDLRTGFGIHFFDRQNPLCMFGILGRKRIGWIRHER